MDMMTSSEALQSGEPKSENPGLARQVKISAIIPTHNRSDLLSATVESLFQQTLDEEDYEVIVVDNASTDGTRELCEQYTVRKNFRYFYEPRIGLNASRQRGVVESRGIYVALTDDDAIPSPVWLEKLVEGFERATPHPGSVGGKIFPKWEVPKPSWLPARKLVYLTILDYGDLPLFIKYPKILYGANMAFDKELLLKYGTFRDDLDRKKRKLIGGGDSWVFKKFADYDIPVYYFPEASVHHLAPKDRVTKQWLYRRHYWQGRTEILLLPENQPLDEVPKLMKNSFLEIKRLTKEIYSEDREDVVFGYVADLLQQIGRLHQLTILRFRGRK